MARYIGPKTKIARKFSDPIFGPDKYLQKKTILQVNMELIKEEGKNLNMLFNYLKNKKLNTLMVF